MSTGKGAAAKVVKVSANGSIIREFNDPNAKNISFVNFSFGVPWKSLLGQHQLQLHWEIATEVKAA